MKHFFGTKKSNRTAGFGHIELIIAVLFIGIFAFVGIKVLTGSNAATLPFLTQKQCTLLGRTWNGSTTTNPCNKVCAVNQGTYVVMATYDYCSAAVTPASAMNAAACAANGRIALATSTVYVGCARHAPQTAGASYANAAQCSTTGSTYVVATPQDKCVAKTTVAVPVVTVSVSPGTITVGSAATVSWSVSNAPTTCTASGAWSGVKAAAGSITTGTISTTGKFTYTLNCSNSAGSSTGSSVLTVNGTAAVYCSGQTPCYGPNDLAAHATASNCWAYNLNRVINVTAMNTSLHSAMYGNLLPTNNVTICGNVNLAPYLNGTSAIYGIGAHNHGSAAKNNTGVTASYLVGYYDAVKP